MNVSTNRAGRFSKPPPSLHFSLPHRGLDGPSGREGPSFVLLILLLISGDLRLFQVLMNAEDNFKSSSPVENKRHTNAHQLSPPQQVTLKHRGRAMGVPGVVRKPAHKNGSNTLVVVEVDRRTRRLSAIQVAELDLIFEPGLAMEAASNRRPRRFEKLPLVPVN